ncbi:MAG: peroxidase family protein [Rhodopila sp.]|nr:peroxidase family protein [Rhodopila sp.]
MSRHGGGPVKPRANQKAHDAFRTVIVEGLPRGFRHYALRGRYWPAATADRQAMAERYARLASRMTAPLDWGAVPPRQPGLDDPIKKDAADIRDNPYIPSGYTYFLQFIAHDMVSTRTPFWATTTLDQDTANDRTNRLRLDTLYGSGPNERPVLYAPADPNDLSRVKLQIGRSGPVGTENGATICPFRDFARLKLSDTLADLPGLTEPLVADRRNDDQPLISQLTMVFCHLHNIFVDRQGAVPADGPRLDFAHDTAKLFANAREATTLVYRHVIREDLLKRILHPAVHALYSTGAFPFLDTLAGTRIGGVSLEFSHGAFRFGHAMVRDSYQINATSPTFGQFLKDGLTRFSSNGNVRMEPMSAAWLIQWSNFFNFPGITDPNRINLSRRIGPSAPLSLSAHALGPIDPSQGGGIFYRDLISAELANLWPVEDLLAAMREHEALAPIVNSSALLRDDNWQNEIMSWLPRSDFLGAPEPWGGQPEEVMHDELAAITLSPPLPFFVLFEAYKDPESRGCRLGRFGSILVADTLFGELNNRLPSEQLYGSLSEQLKSVHPAFADQAFDGPVTMASVIGFIDRCLRQSDDPAMKYPSLL